MRKKNYFGVHIGRFVNLPWIYFGQIMLIRCWAYCLEINGKWINIQGANTNYSPTSSAFLAIFKAPTEKLMANSQIGFNIWLNNVNSKLNFFFLNLCYGALKSKFIDCMSSSLNLIDRQQMHFWQLLKVPEEKLIKHSQFRFQNWLKNVDSELYFFLSK